ncbi:hypothetical protein [Mycolicibacterium fortuitum]|uniref:hypothetical protein n=1 Tax=Mycolicibacterium fortuitum TaxID=1766 RepID=UPI001F3878D7|nr:hypothetical protein [Mycolicibacterium fortuitum]
MSRGNHLVIGHLSGEELIHASRIVDPHDLQRGFEQPGEPARPVATPGINSIASPRARSVRRGDVGVQKAVVVEKRVVGIGTSQTLQLVQRLLRQAQADVIDDY